MTPEYSSNIPAQASNASRQVVDLVQTVKATAAGSVGLVQKLKIVIAAQRHSHLLPVAYSRRTAKAHGNLVG
jgi:hypothetical protein